MQKQYSDELRKLPKGNIYYKKEHGHYRPYVVRRGKEKYIRLEQILQMMGFMQKHQ